MIAHVVREFRGHERDANGQQRRREWWWFFTTDPHEYSVYWQPDGSKTMDQFLREQLALVLARLNITGAH